MRNFILFCILLTCTYAQDFASLENNKTFYMKKAKENFGYLGNVKSPEGIDGQANIYIPQQFENIIAQYTQKGEPKKYLTVIWFFSTSMPDSALKRYMALGQKLKKKHPNFKYYAALQGFPKKTNLIEFANKFKNNTGAKDLVVKIHPLLFEQFGLQKVPAYAIGFCPDTFKAKNCEFQYLLKGDIDLADAFSMVGDYDKKYKRFYFDLIEAE